MKNTGWHKKPRIRSSRLAIPLDKVDIYFYYQDKKKKKRGACFLCTNFRGFVYATL